MPGEAIAGPVVFVRAFIVGVDKRHIAACRRVRSGSLPWLLVVDTAVSFIESTVQQETEFLVDAEALTEDSVEPSAPVAVLNGIVTAGAPKSIDRTFLSSPRYQVDRTADAIGVLVGGECLEHFDAPDQCSGAGV